MFLINNTKISLLSQLHNYLFRNKHLNISIMYVCRHATTKAIVFATTSGEISITTTGLTSVSAEEFTGVAEGWGSDDGYEVVNLTNSDVDLPSDYAGNVYMLIEDGDSYRFDRI